MKLVSVRTADETLFAQFARFERHRGGDFEIYFAQPQDHRRPLTQDHFFTVGAAIAFALGEDYSQETPISPGLLRNFGKLKDIWLSWYPYRRDIALDVPTLQPAGVAPPAEGSRAQASFFTAGIDSLFTVRQLGDKLSALISVVHGEYDVARIQQERARLSDHTAYARAAGLRHLVAASNAMTAVPEFFNAYAFLGHGAMLASIAHFLSGEVSGATISSSHTYEQLIPWGSHPETDPLLSSELVKIDHFGADTNRVGKTFAIAGDPAALRILNVCSRGRTAGKFGNCSRCQKCVRTMLTLDLAGVDKAACPEFDWRSYDPAKAQTLVLRTPNEYLFAREIRDAAARLGRQDIVVPTERLIRRSSRYLVLTRLEMYVRKRMAIDGAMRGRLSRLRGLVYRGLGLKRELQD